MNMLNLLALILVFIAAGFSIFSLVSLSSAESLPMPAQENEQVKEAYLFAKENPELLENLPCFCGCVNMGHHHNRDCYINDDGKWDDHGSLCGGCVSVTLDAKRMFLNGSSTKEIRDFVDAKQGAEEMADPTPTPPVL